MDMGIEDKLNLDSALLGELPCEGGGHVKGYEFHDDGPGVWYVTAYCDACKVTETYLVCEKYKSFLLGLASDVLGVHLSCGKKILVARSIRSVVRK